MTRHVKATGGVPRHTPKPPTGRVGQILAVTLTAVMVFAVSAAASVVWNVNDNVTRLDIADLVDTSSQDSYSGRAVNILLLGSDTRIGDGNQTLGGGTSGGMRSDTAIVAHISADRSRIDLVSIPRDSLVDIPACNTTNGTTSAQHDGMFNAAFSLGWDRGKDIVSAAACTWATVEANTGIKLDHFILVDFSGFESMIDAIGGVPMCIPHDMRSSKAHLDLTAGYQTLDGTTALAFARARTGVGLGDGSDTARVGRQQELMSAIVTKVLSADVLGDPSKSVPFLSATAESVTTDSALTLNNMTQLAHSLREIRTNDVSFRTIPFRSAAPERPGRVRWTAEATTIWQAMAADQPLDQPAEPAATDTDNGSDSSETSAPTTPASDPESVAPTTEVPATPTPAQTRKAGRESFTADDVTAVC